MADHNTLARPYAKAIFELAKEHKKFSNWLSQLEILCEIVNHPRIQVLLADKTIPVLHVSSLVLKLSEGFLEEETKNLVKMMSSRRRLMLLPNVLSLFEEMRMGAENYSKVEFTTAVPIDTNEQEKFSKLLQARLKRTVKMHCAVDKNLLGGFVARAGNYVLDGSLKGQLVKLKEAMGGG